LKYIDVFEQCMKVCATTTCSCTAATLVAYWYTAVTGHLHRMEEVQMDDKHGKRPVSILRLRFCPGQLLNTIV
jgi:hypothetical protein